jgi:probable F420-dependent oxidoreductase
MVPLMSEQFLACGVTTFATATTLSPSVLAKEAEQRGIASLWFAEHSHIPASRKSPWPGGAELPRWYYEAFDPIVAVAAAVSATTTLRVGTGVALIVQRDPIQFAKEVATLDVISDGRIDVGVSAGWNIEEMTDHGTDPARRWKLMRERVEAVKAIWTTDPSQYHGEMVDFGPMTSLPKPIQRPHPPVYIGGAYPQGMRRAVRYGDGWMPILGRGGPDVAELVTALRNHADDSGRDPSSVRFIAYGLPTDQSSVSQLREAGVDLAVFNVRPGAPAEMIAQLDKVAAITNVG